LKEFIALDKSVKQDFHLDTRFDLLPENLDAFAAAAVKYAMQFGYSFLLNVPTAHQVDATNANLFTYSASNHMLETWNRVMDKSIAINANETWGTRDWTRGNDDFQIAEMTQARSEVGMANAVTIIGGKRILERWKSTIMSHQIMQLLSPEVQVAIKIHKKRFQWTNPLPNETIDNGRALLHQVLKLMRPDVQTNVYAKLAKIKNIKPIDYAFYIMNGILQWNPNESPSILKSQEHTTNPSISWITLMHHSLLTPRVSRPRSTFFGTDTFEAIQIVGTHHTLLAKSSRLTTICSKMELGSKKLAKKIRLLLLLPS
jgi:hypothetical protein